MANPTLTTISRSETGKNACRRIRATGAIPAVIYGTDKNPTNIQVDNHDMRMLLQHEGPSVIIALESSEEKNETLCVIREILRDPVTGKYLHIDFLRLDMSAKTNFTVEVFPVGIPEGVRLGGVLDILAHTIAIRCLPENMPHRIEVPVEHLEINQTLYAYDLELGEDVELHCDPSMTVLTVLARRGVEEEEEEAEDEEDEGEDAEPEVIGKKKEDEENE